MTSHLEAFGQALEPITEALVDKALSEVSKADVLTWEQVHMVATEIISSTVTAFNCQLEALSSAPVLASYPIDEITTLIGIYKIEDPTHLNRTVLQYFPQLITNKLSKQISAPEDADNSPLGQFYSQLERELISVKESAVKEANTLAPNATETDRSRHIRNILENTEEKFCAWACGYINTFELPPDVPYTSKDFQKWCEQRILSISNQILQPQGAFFREIHDIFLTCRNS